MNMYANNCNYPKSPPPQPQGNQANIIQNGMPYTQSGSPGFNPFQQLQPQGGQVWCPQNQPLGYERFQQPQSGCSISYAKNETPAYNQYMQPQPPAFPVGYTQTGFPSDLVATFSNVVNRFLISEVIHPERRDRWTGVGNLFYDEENLFFTVESFKKIVGALNVSRPALLRALREADLLTGSWVNKESCESCVTICCVDGESHTETVYQVSRSVLDFPGDPYVFPGEGLA